MEESDADAENDTKLKPGTHVEVLQLEVGLRGSWHPGVVTRIQPGRRFVKYNELLSNNGSEHLVESIPVPKCMDADNTKARGRPCRLRIRPLPPVCTKMAVWKKGMHVDVSYQDAWWEGVLLEDLLTKNESVSVRVFFPDEGDVQKYFPSSLRIAQKWDAKTGDWSIRGFVGIETTPKTTKSEDFLPSSQTALLLCSRRVASSASTENDREGNSDAATENLNDTARNSNEVKVAADNFDEAAENKQEINGCMIEPVECTKQNLREGSSDISECVQIEAKVNGAQALFADITESDPWSQRNSEGEVAQTRATYKCEDSSDSGMLITPNKKEGAKKALRDCGWDVHARWRPDYSRQDLYYISPDGVTFRSLHAACKEWSRTQEGLANIPPDILAFMSKWMINNEDTCGTVTPVAAVAVSAITTAEGSKKIRRQLRMCGQADSASKSKKRKISSHHEGPLVASGSSVKQRARVEILPGKHDSSRKTILSWLIDMKVLKEDAAIAYRNRKTKEVMVEGVAKPEGVICKCCNKQWTLSAFEAHAGSKLHRPCANIFVDDGRSLSDLQVQALAAAEDDRQKPDKNFKGRHFNDDTCGVCGDGGELICCDRCPSTFHLTCVQIQDVPEGEWYCPSCRCGICGGSECFNDLTALLLCDQCEREFHVKCVDAKGVTKITRCPDEHWFCGEDCEKIFRELRGLVGTSHSIDGELSWTLLRCTAEDEHDSTSIEVAAEHSSKLAVGLGVMHECFQPMVDPSTKIDMISHILYNRGKAAAVNRLNFRGFYSVLLEKDDELISVASLRIHGSRLAEMPFVATRFKYRRQGMCRRLVNAIEGILRNLSVEALVLPAVTDLLPTWIDGFGFEEISPSQRLELLGMNVVAFPNLTLLRKDIVNTVITPSLLQYDMDCDQVSEIHEECNAALVQSTSSRCELVKGNIPVAMCLATCRPMIGGEASLIDGLKTVDSGGILLHSTLTKLLTATAADQHQHQHHHQHHQHQQHQHHVVDEEMVLPLEESSYSIFMERIMSANTTTEIRV